MGGQSSSAVNKIPRIVTLRHVVYLGAAAHWTMLGLMSMGIAFGLETNSADVGSAGSEDNTVPTTVLYLFAVVILTAVSAAIVGISSERTQAIRKKQVLLTLLVVITPLGNLLLMALTGGSVESPFTALYISSIAVILTLRRDPKGTYCAMVVAVIGLVAVAFDAVRADWAPLRSQVHQWLSVTSLCCAIGVAAYISVRGSARVEGNA